MVNSNLRYLVIFVFVILSLNFVLAAFSPTALNFGQNITSIYDEGNFTLNWTEPAGSNDNNYVIYIYTDDIYYVSGVNDSSQGYSFNNWTEANYTFTVEAENDSGKANSTNASMYVDRTAPVISLPVYSNATLKKNTDTLILNISVIDAFTGEIGSVCLVDIYGTNESIAVSGEWCNATSFNLTGLTDGNQTIKVYVNDSGNIVGLNDSYVVRMDTTATTITLTLSSSSLDLLNININGAEGACSSDRPAAIISNGILTETGLYCGLPYTYTVTCADPAGNLGSETVSFLTDSCGGISGGGATPSFWTNTYIASEEELEQGYRNEVSVKNRVRVVIGTENHHVGVKSLTDTQATIEVSSNPVEVVLDIGEDTRVDVTGDGFYDIYVILNGISNDKVDITVKKIHEEGAPTAPEEGAVAEEGPSGEEEKTSLTRWLWVVIVLVIIVILFKVMSSKKGKKSR